MPGKERLKIRGKEKLTVRLSANDLRGLDKIRASGDFEDMSASVRWCIHFSVAMLKSIPAAIINSFVESEAAATEEEEKEMPKDDSLEKPANKVPAQNDHCTDRGNCCETKK